MAVCATTVVVSAAPWVSSAAAQSAGGARVSPHVPAAMMADVTLGAIEGVVVDERGRPLAGVAVAVEGLDAGVAVSDAGGHYAFPSLRPGPYWLRARMPGFTSSVRQSVVVRASRATTHAIRLERATLARMVNEAPIVTASLGIDLGLTPPDEADSVEATSVEAEPAGRVEPADNRSLAWRLRHGRRSVLREETARAVDPGLDDRPMFDPSVLLGAVESSARLAASAVAALPLSGQVRFLTTGAFDGPGRVFSSDWFAADSVAHVALESPSGEWTAQAAMTRGDVSAWMAAGNYRLEPADRHGVDVSVSYAAQRYNGANPASLKALVDGGRNVGMVSASDLWSISRRVRISSSLRYGRYDYLDRGNLFSPAMAVSVSPLDGTWLRASVSQVMTAPGAEEFVVSRAIDTWGPPLRTFSPAAGWAALRPERTRQVEVGLEHEIASFVVGIRRSEQRVDDQVMTSFARVDTPSAPPDLRHYVVASVGDAEVRAWTVMVARPVGSRVRGAVEYSLIDARLTPTALVEPASAGSVSGERLHDLTGSIEACVTETRTRVSAAYKVNTGFVRAVSADGLARATDGRFDVQVYQGLPMPGAGTAEWELLVAIRDLFFDRAAGTSAYNELFVVRPPKRVLGGVSVKF